MTAGSEVVLAHHALVVAIPAFAPAIIIVAVVLFIARRDRAAERAESESVNDLKPHHTKDEQ